MSKLNNLWQSLSVITLVVAVWMTYHSYMTGLHLWHIALVSSSVGYTGWRYLTYATRLSQTQLLEKDMSAVLMLDDELNVIEANSNAIKLFGWGSEEWRGENIDHLFGLVTSHEDSTLLRHHEGIEEILTNGEVDSCLCLARCFQAGVDIPIKLRVKKTIKAYLYPHWASYIVYVQDRREEVQTATELSNALYKSQQHEADAKWARDAAEATLKQLQEAAQEKNGFLAMVSHELRTPMASILGWSQMLRWAGVTPEEIDAGLKAIEESATTQSKLVNDLLEMTRFDLGRAEIKLTPVNLSEIIDLAVTRVLPLARQRGLTLTVTNLASGSVMVRADPERVHQVIWNYLSNAMKFTPKGGKIHVVLLKKEGVGIVTVEDTGKGLAQKDLRNVFKRLWKAAQYNADYHQSGLGLGLNICQQIMELHGGDVWADSQGLGKGCTFGFSIPVA